MAIDEDKSATNFMIRDALMRRIVKDEVIIPFTDRIRSITKQKGVSTILVIGGSGEYSVDMTAVSSMKTNEQLHSLAWGLRTVLSREEAGEKTLRA